MADFESPFLGPKMRALQMFQLIDGIARQREARELAQLQYKRGVANDEYEHQRQARLDQATTEQQAAQRRNLDFDNAMKAAGAGAERITDIGQLWASGNKGMIVSGKPKGAGFSGEVYRLPSAEQKQDQQIALDTKKKKAEQDAKPRYKLQADFAKMTGKTEATADEIEQFVKQHNVKESEYYYLPKEDGKGNVTVVKIHKPTMKEVGRTEVGAIGTPSTQAGENPGEIFTKKRQFEEERQKAESLFNQVTLFEQDAKNKEEAGDTEKAQESRAKAEAARKQADSQLQYATTIASDLQQSFPDQIEAGPGDPDTRGVRWPYAKIKPRSTTSPQSASGYPQKFKGAVKASEIPGLAKGYGMDVNAFRKKLGQEGVEIDEKN